MHDTLLLPFDVIALSFMTKVVTVDKLEKISFTDGLLEAKFPYFQVNSPFAVNDIHSKQEFAFRKLEVLSPKFRNILSSHSLLISISSKKIDMTVPAGDRISQNSYTFFEESEYETL